MAYDDVLAKYLHLNMDGAAIRECRLFQKNSKAQTEDVMVLKKTIADMMFDDVLAKYLHLI